MLNSLLLALAVPGGGAPLREKILSAIRKEPGQHGMEICRNTGAAWSTVQYHLDILRKGDMVTTVDGGRTRRFFPPDMDPQRVKLLAMMGEGRRQDVAEFIAKHPGMRQVDICKAVNVSRKTFRNAVAPLVEAELVHERRTLQDNRYFPLEPLENIL